MRNITSARPGEKIVGVQPGKIIGSRSAVKKRGIRSDHVSEHEECLPIFPFLAGNRDREVCLWERSSSHISELDSRSGVAVQKGYNRTRAEAQNRAGLSGLVYIALTIHPCVDVKSHIHAYIQRYCGIHGTLFSSQRAAFFGL
jgi:hypothetical protein